eukprot:gene2773-3209_t
MFNKAKELVHADPPIVIPQPAFDYGEYVGSYGNKLYPVTLGRQQECFHHSSSVCEHLLSLAQKKGNLQAFINFFRKQGKGQDLLQLTTNDGHVNAWKKCKLQKDLLSVATVAKKGAEMNFSKETCAVVKDKHNLVIPHIVDDE